ncbi:hypothetical protein [Halodesulfovibrio sp. MK-HDV]|uniref:hypothetical protein n=1 Tax=Halodesulfovibrio sp. MK-HDV TaxID=2599925 RepID=UPI0013FBC670|nr:hypothetical protein [Halodesulfovibrio sp. MK-HDV]KAF1074876.1 hypothetical protein MKHDV_02428 [Halodesulfovibrio sp. MK-HDV]
MNVIKRLIVSFFERSPQTDTDSSGSKIGSGAYALTIPSDFQKIGQLSVNIPLNTEVSGQFPRGTMHSKIYTDGETILFVQRMSSPAGNNYFKQLGGEKVAKWDKDWCKNTYSMNALDTTQQFEKYSKFIKEKGLSECSDYLVEMYDRLASRTSIARVIVFTPNDVAKYPTVPMSSARYHVENNN